ncbi:MAG: hypothetical protein KH354_07185 [Clostridiales bacterium]|nr:hypothetical protein [Clostridiales bacterium]
MKKTPLSFPQRSSLCWRARVFFTPCFRLAAKHLCRGNGDRISIRIPERVGNNRSA